MVGQIIKIKGNPNTRYIILKSLLVNGLWTIKQLNGYMVGSQYTFNISENKWYQDQDCKIQMRYDKIFRILRN